MKANEPMTDEQVVEIREQAHWAREVVSRQPDDEGWADGYANDVPPLLAEVDRLRAREQALQLQLDAMSSLLLDVQRDCVAARQEANVMRPMVEAVANTHGRLHCALDCRVNDRWNTEFHAPDCLITQARAFVAAHPATTGEAESEGE